MLARLGSALYLMCCVMATAMFAVGAFAATGEGVRDNPWAWVVVAVITVAIWLIGLACRHVLSGK
jgi:hypothetical protein